MRPAPASRARAIRRAAAKRARAHTAARTRDCARQRGALRSRAGHACKPAPPARRSPNPGRTGTQPGSPPPMNAAALPGDAESDPDHDKTYLPSTWGIGGAIQGLGRGLISSWPDSGRCDLDRGEEVGGKLCVACGDAAEKPRSVRYRLLEACSIFAPLRSGMFDRVADPFGVTGLVGRKEAVRRQVRQQGCGSPAVMRLAGAPRRFVCNVRIIGVLFRNRLTHGNRW